jgi:diamine N-acetyltransferase
VPAAAVELVDVDADNWRAVAAVRPRPEQQDFVAATTYYLCLCHYGGVWRPLAARIDDEVVGYVQWGVDDDGSHWIGGLVVDAAHQGRGVGRGIVEALIARLSPLAGAAGLALSYQPANTAARALYASLGFVETGELVDDEEEVVARLRPAQTTP